MASSLTTSVLGSANATVATTVAATVKLPANIPVIVGVENHHTTAASLSTITLASASATWVSLGTRTDGAGSPNRRLTLFRTMVSADAASEVVTATAVNSINQTALRIVLVAVGGANLTGTNGSGCIAQTVGGDTAGASATSLSVSISMTAGNGALAFFVSGTTGLITPRTAWTEISDTSIGTNEIEVQFKAGTDTAASATGSSGVWIGLVVEIKPISENAPAVALVGTLTNSGGGYATGSTLIGGIGGVFRAGRAYYAVVEASPQTNITGVDAAFVDGSGNALGNPSAASIHASASGTTNGRLTVIFRIAVSGAIDIPATCQFNLNATGSGNMTVSGQIVEVGNIDPTVGTNGAISETASSTNAGSSLALSNPTPGSVANFFLLLVGTPSSTGFSGGGLDPGWILLQNTVANSTEATASAYRYSAPNPTTYGFSGSNGSAGVVVEFQPLVIQTPPVVTLVAPGNGSTIGITGSLTIKATDVDGDLSTVTITANGNPVYTGGAFQSGFTGSSTSPLTSPNGTQFVVTPSAWTPGALGVVVVATDSRGNVTIGLFNFTVAGNDFSLSRTPSSLSILQGNANTVSVSASLTSGSAETVTLSISGLPTGVTAGFSPSTITPGGGSSTLTLTVGGSVAPATYTLTITGTAASASHATTVALTVTTPAVHAPVITLVGPPSPGAIGQFEGATITITDVDNDLAISTILANANAETAYTASAFAAGYTASAQLTITNGVQLTFRRNLGWTGGALALFIQASDTGGRTATAFFSWSPVSAPSISTAGSFTVATAIGDVRVEWGNGETDATIISDDIGADLGMRTAVLLSLLTDRRAEEDDDLPSADGDRRGWWGDQFAAVDGDLMGSRLWLLDRSAKTEGVTQRAEEYVRESLAWMLEDHVADRIDVTVTDPGAELLIAVEIHRPNAKPITFRFANVWASP